MSSRNESFFSTEKLIFEACITVVHYFAIHIINTVVNINEVTMLICCGIRHIEQSCFEVFGDYSSEQSYSKQILDISRHHFCEKIMQVGCHHQIDSKSIFNSLNSIS